MCGADWVACTCTVQIGQQVQIGQRQCLLCFPIALQVNSVFYGTVGNLKSR
uniref:Uncharacterized protein n=1 Tax=Anguilla anguilla TaxID=7936 RepID=A0A0E9WDV4_ANGAN